MSQKRAPKVLISQLEDALEERHGRDRRQQHAGLPEDVAKERRKGDRRTIAEK